MTSTMIKNEFKDTELGKIPVDWEVGYIGDLCKITTGNKNTQDHRANGLYPFFVRSNKIERIDSYSFDGEAVLTAGDGVGTGKVFHYVNGKFDFHQRVYKLSNFSNSIHGYYFYLIFRNNFYNRIIQMTAKSSVDSVRLEMISGMPIPLPSLDEQKAIAEALTETDELIEKLEKVISKKKLIKQGAMHELLTGKKRLPEFDKDLGYKDTELGEIPVDWEIQRLDDLTKVFTKQTGFDYSAHIKPSLVQSKSDDTIPFIQNKDFNNRWVNLNTDYFIPRSVAIKFPQILLDEKSLLISISGRIGNVGIYDINEIAFLGGAIAVLKFKKPELIDWVMHFLNSSIGQTKLIGNAKSSSHQNLILDDIRKVSVAFPSLAEQKAIAKVLSDMDDEIESLEIKLDKYKKIKQGMMQDLLTGKVRLVNANK